MSQSLPATHIEAHVGNVSGGQVAIGNYIVQIGRVEGGVVNILNEAPPPPKTRPQPVSLRPKPFPGLLDRETETAELIGALTSQQSVECTGQSGAGKTALLRHLAHESQLPGIFLSGVVYFQVNQQSAADLLKSLFDAFYTCDFPIKPNETEIRFYLQSVNALVLLDDVEIAAQQIEFLMNLAPNCTFIAVTKERSLLGEVREVPLKGLPIGDAVRLFEKELQRPLLSDEEKAAQLICESVACIPLQVLRAAHEARQENRSLLPVASGGQLTPGDPRLATSEIKSASEDEKKVLTALAAFVGAPVAAEHVGMVAGVMSVEPVLAALERRGLVQSYDRRFTLAGDVKADQLGDLKPSFARALVHFLDWTKQRRNQPEEIARSAEAILAIQKWAVSAQAWNEVSRLGHATEEALTLTGKWDMWAKVLNDIKAAAQAQGNIAESAWTLHQLGTRALCLGDRSAAEAALKDALRIRERINDQSGAAVTRHNLNILLNPLPPKTKRDEPSDNGAGSGSISTPVFLKISVMVLVGLAALVSVVTGLIIWKSRASKPPVVPPKIASFSVTPSAVPANSQAQLCYEVENAGSVRIEPNIGEKPATKGCLTVMPSETTTYTLVAYASDGSTTRQHVTLNVEAAPPQAQIVAFEVRRPNGDSGVNDGQFRLCYEVRKAAHAELDNNGGTVVLDRPQCQQIRPQQATVYTLSATGADGITVTRQATADPGRLPSLPPQILSLEAVPQKVVNEGEAQLCFQLKDASSAQVDPGVRSVSIGTGRQCVSVRPLQTTTYTLRAFNAEGKEEKKDVTIKVSRPPTILEFWADRKEVLPGESVKICYQVKNARSLQIDNGIGEVRPVDSGCVTTIIGKTSSAIDPAKIFQLTASGLEGETSTREIRITVRTPHVDITEFTVNPQKITRGDSVSLCFRAENASAVGIEPVTKRIASPNGERICIPHQPKTTMTYTLTAFNEWGVRPPTRQAEVIVEEPKLRQARILFFEISSPRIKRGESVNLCYGVAEATTTRISPLRGEFPNSEKYCIHQSPRDSTVYILSATGEDRQAVTREVTVEVEEAVAPPVRIKRFEINPTWAHGTQLCYELENARSASIEPGFGELRNLTKDCPKLGSRKEQTYTLTATGADGNTVQKEVTYTPPPPPKEGPIHILSFWPATQTIKAGNQAKICYSTSGIGTAEITPQPGSVSPLLYSCVKVAPTDDTDYILTVTGPGGEKETKKVSVKVAKQGGVIY